jgi:serine/threonine protein kinase/tetratricopeptide (TPR) repeat protein
MVGRRLSHYEIVDEISRGGMGIVYRAVDVNLGREVAIKVLPDDLLGDPDRRARLLHEARSASSLEHPHIAVIHEVGDAGDVTFVAMELIRGEKLSDLIAGGPIAHPRALTLAAEIAEGLARAHEKGIVHRDLKPANVMVTHDGHAKIIDFGLAKVLEPVGDGSTMTLNVPRTREGTVVGTAAYMSPEQARGGRVDHRTDIFALGVTLYEMVTGRPAFSGRSTLDTLQAVLTQQVPPLAALAGGAPDALAELQRIIAKCTAKEPDDRYQGMKDLVVDLRAARRRFESSEDLSASHAPVVRQRPPLTARLAIPFALVFVVAGVALFLWSRREPELASPPSDRPAVAVMYFENNTGDSSLDWMRTGLTDMLVTNLSQSTDFEVLGTDRLVQILQDLRRLDDRVLAADVVEEIADRARVENVLVGSYVRAGGTIRISARIQDARSGRIVTAENVEGEGESALFRLVDELTRRFAASMRTLRTGPSSLLPKPGEGESGLDRGLSQITTSSIEAYRYYAEGLAFHERNLSAQAVPLLQKATEIDSDFAMAYAKLAVVNNNLGRMIERDQYARQALARVDRLTTRERYYIEGFYYSLRSETTARGIESYKRGLQLHPEHQASRHNLALIYQLLERYEEGIVESEELLRRGTSNATTYENLVDMLMNVNNAERARRVAEQLVQQRPDNVVAHRTVGTVAMLEGRLDDARHAFDKSSQLDPFSFASRLGSFMVALLQQRWEDARSLRDEMVQSRNPFVRFLAMVTGAQLEVARGRERAAREMWTRALQTEGLAPLPRAFGRNRFAEWLLQAGHAPEALAQAELSLKDAEGLDAEFETLELLAAAQAAAGRVGDADQTIARLGTRATIVPSNRESRRIHRARAAAARRRGDVKTALTELNAAVALLPPVGPPLGPPPEHMSYWLAAAQANAQAGDHDEAIRLLERMQTRHYRAHDMDAWVRSLYLLGQLYEQRGDQDRARQHYARFVTLWGDGEMERAWVADARRKLGR